jgi:hypothetical protein
VPPRSGRPVEKGDVVTVHIVRLGSSRVAGEGLRIGTVRRPPRGVPAARFASDDWYDEARCHRSLLRELLTARGARVG